MPYSRMGDICEKVLGVAEIAAHSKEDFGYILYFLKDAISKRLETEYEVEEEPFLSVKPKELKNEGDGKD